jgi:hypothetical protein
MSQQDYAIPANLLSKGVSLLPHIQLPHHSGTAKYHSRGGNISSAPAFRQPMLNQRRYVSIEIITC